MGVGIESYGHRWLYKGEMIEVGGKSIDYVEDGARRQTIVGMGAEGFLLSKNEL